MDFLSTKVILKHLTFSRFYEPQEFVYNRNLTLFFGRDRNSKSQKCKCPMGGVALGVGGKSPIGRYIKIYSCTPKRDNKHPCPFHLGVPPG